MTATLNRQIIVVDLWPLAGSRFQPTGFPDIGAATFERPERNGDGTVTWRPALLLESAQSMANRLEATAWPEGAEHPVDAVAGLPYVRVLDGEGRYLTSSRTESHRLASPFVLRDAMLADREMPKVLRERFGLADDTPVAPRDIARELFSLDPFCLLHGVFFAVKTWPSQPKLARAVTAEIEAVGVRQADSGGVKRDHVRHTQTEGGGSAEGYGSVPFHRTEWTAEEIRATFVVDLAQLRSYALGEPATELLIALARWEIRSLLAAPLRLRTACDLEPTSPELVDRAGEPLPTMEELTAQVRAGIESCRDALGDGAPTEVTWSKRRARTP